MLDSLTVKRLVVFIILAQLFTAFVGRSLNPLAIYIGDSLQLTNFQLGLLPTALFLGQFLATLPIGFLADYLPTHVLLLVLMTLVALGFWLLSIIQGFYFFTLLFIVLAGLGYGGMHPVTNKMIVQLYPSQKATLQMGLKQMSITLGSALTSIILLIVAERFGWQIGIQSASLILGIFALVLFFILKPYKETFQSFQTVESSIWSQFKKLAKSRVLLFTTLIALCLMGIQVTFNTYLLLYLTNLKGWVVMIAGFALASSEIFGATGRVIWGMISDRLFRGNRWLPLIIISLWFPLALYFIHSTSNVILLFILIISIGFTVSGFNGLWMNLAVESVPRSLSGSASGYSVTFASTGVFIIPPVFGLLIDRYSYVYAGTFLIFISLVCCCLALTMFLRKRVAEE